ncbi:MAG: PadR family transcriptional regulator [Chloroflexi bacterium]|nr:PadR family transcriptional regulator [Chloroflexota bacterium]
MSLPHAILGLLTITPMTGYDLKHRAFDISIAHFWQADQAQIYRTLGSMTKAGWAECVVEIQDARPNRKVYHITEAGREELRRWLHMEQALPVYREPFLVQMFFAGELDTATILDHIARQRAGHEERLSQYQQIPMPPPDDPDLDRKHTFWRLTLEFGIALEETYLRWLDQCEAAIRSKEPPGEPPAP